MPPHDLAAEAGVLGCCLLDQKCVGQVLERISVYGKPQEVFYELRHQEVFDVMRFLSGEKGQVIDLITMQAELRNRGKLDAVGGVHYLCSLSDAVPSAANLETYLSIVWEKFIARQLLARTTRAQSAVYERNGISEGGIAAVERELEEWSSLAKHANGITPQDLKRPGEFGEECFKLWFAEHQDEAPGLALPFGFPFKIRTHELTLVCGEDGSGKSIFMGQLAICLMKQGWNGFLASFEVRAAVSLWMMQRQILGMGPRLARGEENERKVAKALAFLNARMWLYDFVGITDWRLLLDVMRYAAEKCGTNFFVIDSMMRLGIAEDDLTTQSIFMAQLGGFTVQTGTHVFLVHHLNKTREASLKGKVTGSKRITDNANNIVEMQRNGKKKEKMDELENRWAAHQIEESEYKSKMGELRPEYDAKFLLGKQRYPGTPQNGSKWLWFDAPSLQFRDKLDGGVIDYLL